jgi:hypothetical protein
MGVVNRKKIRFNTHHNACFDDLSINFLNKCNIFLKPKQRSANWTNLYPVCP